MIRKIQLFDMIMSGEEEEFFIAGSGRILKIKIITKPGVTIQIQTLEGETVLDQVTGEGVYYPRSNISSRKAADNPLTGEVQESDYFYFADELMVVVKSDKELDDEVAIEELIILYDDYSNMP